MHANYYYRIRNLGTYIRVVVPKATNEIY